MVIKVQSSLCVSLCKEFLTASNDAEALLGRHGVGHYATLLHRLHEQ